MDDHHGQAAEVIMTDKLQLIGNEENINSALAGAELKTETFYGGFFNISLLIIGIILSQVKNWRSDLFIFANAQQGISPFTV